MSTEQLDWITAFVAVVSAVLWIFSAKVRFKFGYDSDFDLNAAMRKAGNLSMFAAMASAVAAAMPAVKVVLLHFKLLVVSV